MLKFLVKYTQVFVYTCNLLFLVLGVIIFGIGMWAKLSVTNMDCLINSSVISNSSAILITSGVAVTLLSAFGFYATRRKLRKLLKLFAVSILVIFVLELGGGLYAFTNRKHVRKQLSKGIEATVLYEYEGYTPRAKLRTVAFDWIQKNVECCGSDGPNDWNNSTWYRNKVCKLTNANGLRVPATCCIDAVEGCNEGRDISTLVGGKLIHPDGCKEKADTFLKRCFTAVGRIGMTVACIQLIGIVMVYCLSSVIKKLEKKCPSTPSGKPLVPVPPPRASPSPYK